MRSLVVLLGVCALLGCGGGPASGDGRCQKYCSSTCAKVALCAVSYGTPTITDCETTCLDVLDQMFEACGYAPKECVSELETMRASSCEALFVQRSDGSC